MTDREFEEVRQLLFSVVPIGQYHDVLEALSDIRATSDKQEAMHTDDKSVDRFAQAMKEKMAAARAKGRGGWEQCSPDDLSRMLREHVEKGDPRDVANFCMMLWNNGAGISKESDKQEAERDAMKQRGLDDQMRRLREQDATKPREDGWKGDPDVTSDKQDRIDEDWLEQFHDAAMTYRVVSVTEAPAAFDYLVQIAKGASK
ncbi:hypothetical protein [Caballeronia sp. LZ001]|uniref:hypothetical protein n=1 Tax=Caballeronia sp. LZ001 TaxID=3038553 RepID=UPI002862B26A|nr:hypothetical protein [Caballeronia sp. LZ001]MDR5802171.1 hypothetical protein [Caballeronia sp. LZ001]